VDSKGEKRRPNSSKLGITNFERRLTEQNGRKEIDSGSHKEERFGSEKRGERRQEEKGKLTCIRMRKKKVKWMGSSTKGATARAAIGCGKGEESRELHQSV